MTGPKEALSLTDEQVAGIGSVFNFQGASGVKEIQKAHLERDPLRIPLLFTQDVVRGCRTICPVPLALDASFDTRIAEECCRRGARCIRANGRLGTRF